MAYRLAGFTRPAQARAARGEIEATLAAAGWPWSRRLSLWLDVLVLLEEEAREARAQARLARHFRCCPDCQETSQRTGRLCPIGQRLAHPPWRQRNSWSPEVES